MTVLTDNKVFSQDSVPKACLLYWTTKSGSLMHLEAHRNPCDQMWFQKDGLMVSLCPVVCYVLHKDHNKYQTCLILKIHNQGDFRSCR